MKKQKGKGGKTSTASKKEDAPASTKEEDDEAEASQDAVDPNSAVIPSEEEEKTPSNDIRTMTEDSSKETQQSPANPLHNRAPSLSVQSRMRSSSFRKGSLSQGPLPPSANGSIPADLATMSPESDSVNLIYRKQAARLDGLEKENKRLSQQAQEAEKKWRKTEEELEELRDASGEVAELKSKAQKLETQTEELNKVACC